MIKGIVLGIVILLIGIVFSGASYSLSMSKVQISTIEGNILFVGGSGEGNYTTIQDAINDSFEGDTIFVYDDSSPYYESIFIDKSIDLLGENKDRTVIDSRNFSSAIKIKSNLINIEGFTICNGSIKDIDGFSDIEISGNHFINQDENNFGSGITFFYAENIIINSNTFTNCNTSIKLNECIKDIEISNNIFLFNNGTFLAGCEIDCFEGEYITISNNSFINKNKNEYRTCMELDFSNNYIIDGNEINGYEKGISNYCSNSNYNDNNLISHNNFINNNVGVTMPGNNNKIINNNFINNCFGCRLFAGKDNKIFDNNFINNEKDASSTTFYQGNIWNGNYWDGWIGLKIPLMNFLPFVSFSFFGTFIDWQPAKEPYNYTTTQGCGIE